MNIKINELMINGVLRKVVTASIREEKKVEETSVERLHHIHILDRSGSMYSNIDRLVENVKQTIDFMADNDLISVIWFSGEGECKALLKGATKSPDLFKLLDTMKSTLSCTCFSEPLQLANEVIDELKALCPNFSVTMFTDGETVTSHSREEEERRIFQQLEIMKDNVLALNTVGYGNYYNEDLLKRMASMTLFGRMIHSNDIEEYKDIWERQYRILSDCIPENISISSEYSCDIVYLTRNNTKLSKNIMEMNYLDKWKNQFFIVLPTDAKFITIKQGDTANKIEEINLKTPVKMRKDTEKNFLYAYAYELYYAGRTDEALDILAQLKDKRLIDMQLNSFTSQERQAYLDNLKEAIYNNSARDDSAPDNYIPAKDAFCLMDLIRLLAKGNNYYIPSTNYNRIGRAVKDEFNLFNKTKTNNASFKDMVLNEKNLNISLMFNVEGVVKLNPRVAARNGLPNEIQSKMYRNHTIIKDGKPNMDQMMVDMCKETYDTLQSMNTNLKMVREDSEDDKYIVSIDLYSIPVINRKYAEDKDPENLLEIVKKINEHKVMIKVLKEYNKSYQIYEDAYNEGREINGVKYTEEQLEILKEHGLDDKLRYVGVSNKVADKNENDFYMTRSLECSLKGWSSIPKVSDIYDKKQAGKKLNEIGGYMADFIEEACRMTDLKSALESTKAELLDLTLELNTIKMAKILTGSWWENLEVDNKSNYIYKNLIIKTKYEKKYF